ncbi:MAG: ferrous iron transport protein B [Limisphaerales bacterium]
MSVPVSRPPAAPAAREFWVALTGNPNCGKTTVFNVLTGLRAKVGNYAGVTVERKEGRLKGAPAGHAITVLDLPGTYSLSPQSPDEQVARDILFARLPDVPAPDLVVVVVDASNLERNLYYATQVIELGYPVVVALNMVDVARDNGHEIDLPALRAALGVPVLPLVASRGEGLGAVTAEIVTRALDREGNRPPAPRVFATLPVALAIEANQLCAALRPAFPHRRARVEPEALLLLGDDKVFAQAGGLYPAGLHGQVTAARARLAEQGLDWSGAGIEARYARVAEITAGALRETAPPGDTFSDRLDRVLTHKVWGLLIFVGIMALMFQSIFSFAEVPMGWIEGAVGALAGWVRATLPPGDLSDLLTDGVIAGVGAVIIFLPQILLLFLFISLLEDTGYMARAAFLMDRLMSKVGLHGKSFIPLLSSFACAIPGIMATRTIEAPRDRLVTILVAPLMSCSARLPVYTVLIAATVPDRRMLGLLGLPGLTMLAMYLLGIVVALGMAWLFKRTLLKGRSPLLIMELPPYKRPGAAAVLRHMWERSKLFLRRAGSVILVISMVLWVLATYPRSEAMEADHAQRRGEIEAWHEVTRRNFTGEDQARFDTEAAGRFDALAAEAAGERLRHSFAGRLGHAIEPLIAPLGFDWKMGIGIVASFAAREVFVSTMSTVYNVGDFDDSEEGVRGLAETLRAQRHADGRPVYTPLVAVTLMVFYVFALQCVSTIAVVRRETASWRWPLFQLAYMTALAWVLAFLTYQGGRALGWG